MHAWIFVVFVAVASIGPFLSRYDNPDAEWAEFASDSVAGEPPPPEAAEETFDA